jgi:hypothetical protein
MKKYYYIALASLLLMTGCKDSFDMDDLHEKAKLVVNCFPSMEDTTWIEVTHSIPVGKGATTNLQYNSMEVRNAHVVYTVNGEQRVVGWKDGISIPGTEAKMSGRYFVTGRHQVGDRVDIKVSAPDYADVNASTVVGEGVPVTLDSLIETQVYDEEDQYTRSVYQLSATFTDPATTTDYYAVRVRCKHYQGTAIGDLRPEYVNNDLYDNDEWRHVVWSLRHEWEYENVCSGWGEVYDFHLQLDSIYSQPEILTMSEPLLQPLGGIDSDFGFGNDFYQNFYIFTDEDINGQTYTLHLNISAYHVQAPFDEYGFRPVQYQVQLYHLTPEMYRYVKSINDVDNNDLVEGGFSMVQLTYSNVRGGIGIVGGYGYSESDWKTMQ